MPNKWDGLDRRESSRNFRIADEEMMQRIATNAVKIAFAKLKIDLDDEDSVEAIQGISFMGRAYQKIRKKTFSAAESIIGWVLALSILYAMAIKMGFVEFLGKISRLWNGSGP